MVQIWDSRSPKHGKNPSKSWWRDEPFPTSSPPEVYTAATHVAARDLKTLGRSKHDLMDWWKLDVISLNLVPDHLIGYDFMRFYDDCFWKDFHIDPAYEVASMIFIQKSIRDSKAIRLQTSNSVGTQRSHASSTFNHLFIIHRMNQYAQVPSCTFN